MDTSTSAPKLIEDTAKNYMYHTLQKVHATRVKYNNLILNILVFFGFLAVVGGTLWYLHANKKPQRQKYNQLMKDQEYVLSKIRFYQDQQRKINENASSYSSLITELPVIPPTIL